MDGLKQRIIGALVLVSLAVIFVPMMFDEPHSEREASAIQIPEEPPFPEVDMPEPEAVEPPDYYIEEETQPAEPGVEDTPVAQPEEAGQTGQTGQTGQRDDRPEPEPASKEPAEPAESAPVSAEFTRSLEGAWVVQLGSFGNSDNASRLRERVREKGYSSHLQSVQRGDSELTRVFSGPFAEKAEAKRAKKVLDKAFDLDSLVTSGGSD